MNLHRIEGEPEWAGLKPEQLNTWQKVALRSGGIITIGNYFSLLGLVSVPFGLSLILDSQYIAGVIILSLGRLCDLLDGYFADKTGTKSPLGEKVDAIFDKLSTGLALVVLGLSGLLPVWVMAALALPHVIVGFMATVVFVYGLVLHPSQYGKWSMAAGWLAMLAFIITHALHGTMHTIAIAGAYLLFAVSITIGLVAVVLYCREYLRLMHTSKT